MERSVIWWSWVVGFEALPAAQRTGLVGRSVTSQRVPGDLRWVFSLLQPCQFEQCIVHALQSLKGVLECKPGEASVSLHPKSPVPFFGSHPGRQCCGGSVTLLLRVALSVTARTQC